MSYLASASDGSVCSHALKKDALVNQQKFWPCLLVLACYMALSLESAFAQKARSYGGWQKSNKAPSHVGSETRYFQSGSLSDVELPDINSFPSGNSVGSTAPGLGQPTLPPTLPESMPATYPGNSGGSFPQAPSGLPTNAGSAPLNSQVVAPPPLGNQGQIGLPESNTMPNAGTINDSSRGLSDPYPSAASPTLPTGSYQYENQPAPVQNTPIPQGLPRNRDNTGVTTAASTQILPRENGLVAESRQPYGTNQQYGSNQLRSTDAQRSGNELRQGAPDRARLQPASQPPIHTGLPFATDKPRRGTYPTSTYNPALFQMAAYQRATGSNSLARTQGQLASQTQAVNGGAGLATDRTMQPGFYPTSYVSCNPPAPSFPATGAVNGTYAPPTYAANVNPGLYTPNNAGYTPLFSLGQENYNVQLGRGIIGQPTVYVTGQPIRNFLRYLFP